MEFNQEEKVLKKNDCIELTIEELEFPNVGVGYYDGERVTAKNTLPGQFIKGQVIKTKRGIQVNCLEVIKKAANEIEPACPVFDMCGGCTYQRLTYADEVEMKGKMVLAVLKAAGIDGFAYDGIVPADNALFYRNKMEFSFGDDGMDGNLTLGMRKRGSFYEAVNADDCRICHKDFTKIAAETHKYFSERNGQFYHRIKQTGTLRNLIVRKGYFTGEILVNIVTASGIKHDLADYASGLLKLPLEGNIVSIIHTENNSPADAVKIDKMNLLYGNGFYMEKLLGLSFKISAFSFFQTNSEGAQHLYETVLELAGDISNKTVFDLYCGTGTIAQLAAKTAKKVIGIELIEEAVSAAKANAELNGITNCRFIADNVLTAVDTLTDKPDIIIIDPPREGIHPKAIGKIIEFGAETVVYVSCKPSSLANDLPVFMASGYMPVKIKCHDMFPRTGNIETCCLLRKP